MISIIIATKNRLDHLLRCIKSIQANSYSEYEIIIIDQTTDDTSKKPIQELLGKNIRYYKHFKLGKSSALNFGISVAKGDIFAFTDDDCIVSKTWISEIALSFKENEDIVMMFGKTLPYMPHKHKSEWCPSVFFHKKRHVITDPKEDYMYIGYGNNMAIRKNALSRANFFKYWLGPGSIGKDAEDLDAALQFLLKGYTLLFNPRILSYHNRWLDTSAFHNQLLSYTRGNVSCLGFYFFRHKGFAKSIFQEKLLGTDLDMHAQLLSELSMENILTKIQYEASSMVIKTLGVIIAIYYSFSDHLKAN